MSDVQRISAERAIQLLFHDGEVIEEGEVEDVSEHANVFGVPVKDTVPAEFLYISN